MTNERLRLALLESRYGPAIGRDSANERLGWLVSSSNRRVSFILLFCLANGRVLLHLDKNAGLTGAGTGHIAGKQMGTLGQAKPGSKVPLSGNLALRPWFDPEISK